MILQKTLKAYALFGKDKNGKLYGYVENSFSMGLSESEVRRWPVLAFDSVLHEELSPYQIKKQEKYQKDLLTMLERDKLRMSKTYPDLEFFIVRLNSKNCPVIIHWKDYKTVKGKYQIRNIRWSKK